MSDVATKLITMADNTPAVAEVVNAAKATASGAVVRVDDVLDAEHKLAVQATAGAEVRVYGKNLTDFPDYLEPTEASVIRNATRQWHFDCKENTQYTVQCEVLTNSTVEHVFWEWRYTDGTYSYSTSAEGGKASTGIIKSTSKEGKTVSGVWVCYVSGGFSVTVRNFQLEIGTEATPYEPYKEPQTATADASGQVTGLRSVASTMTLFSDNDAVTVECSYFPESAADVYAKYQALKAEQIALQEKLQEYLQEGSTNE